MCAGLTKLVSCKLSPLYWQGAQATVSVPNVSARQLGTLSPILIARSEQSRSLSVHGYRSWTHQSVRQPIHGQK